MLTGNMPEKLEIQPVSRGYAAAIAAAAVLGAVLLIAAEPSTLYTVHSSAARGTLKTVTTSSHDKGALYPLAVLAALMALVAWRTGGRFALMAIATVGVVALLLSLLHDLPDARHSGYVKAAAGHVSSAKATAGAGLYLETLGAVVTMLAGVLGLLLTRPSVTRVRAASRRRPIRPAAQRSRIPGAERPPRARRAPGEPLRRRTGGE